MSKLEDVETFALVLDNDDNSLLAKICIRQHVSFNRVYLCEDEKPYFVVYNVNKQYMFNIGTNKKLKFIWKDLDNFFIIDFKNNTKGDIINHLTFEKNVGNKIEGDIVIPNLKEPFKSLKKVQLVSSKQLDDDTPLLYEHFTFYIKNTPSEDSHN